MNWIQRWLPAVLAASFVGATAAAAPVYNMQAIPDAGPYHPEWGSAINSKGWVVGLAARDYDSFCYLYAEGVTRILPDSKGVSCWSLNDHGDVVGVNDYKVYFWPYNGERQDVPGLEYSAAINNQRVIVGNAPFPTSSERAASYADGVLTDLGTLPGGKFSMAAAINQAGDIAGWSNNFKHGDRPFRLKHGGTMENLAGHLKSETIGAVDINDHAHVLGITLDNDKRRFSFIDKDDGQGPQILPTFDRHNLRCDNMNNHDDVICTVSPKMKDDYPVLIIGGQTPYRFRKLLDADSSGWRHVKLYDINDAGQITGEARVNGERRAFIAAPVAR